MISFSSSGSFKNLERFLGKMSRSDVYSHLNSLGQQGVNALRSATPVDRGLTAASWEYEIVKNRGQTTIAWNNTNTRSGVSVAILLQYGHGTGTGGYVQGRDYINPAIRPIFDKIADEVWKAVTSA